MARKVKGKEAKEPTFSVKAHLEFEVDGERFSDDYKITYRGLSAKVMRDLVDDSDGEVTDENRNYVAEQLAQLIIKIDDIVDVDDETQEETPTVIDVAFLDGLTLTNLKAVNTAIRDDVNPPKAQPVS